MHVTDNHQNVSHNRGVSVIVPIYEKVQRKHNTPPKATQREQREYESTGHERLGIQNGTATPSRGFNRRRKFYLKLWHFLGDVMRRRNWSKALGIAELDQIRTFSPVSWGGHSKEIN